MTVADNGPMREQLIEAVLSVIQPDLDGQPMPIFEWGHETTPTADEMRELAGRIADAVIDHLVANPDVVLDALIEAHGRQAVELALDGFPIKGGD